ncbi:MAG: 3-oxoacyl-[acyl-carrier-protein] synthase III C-terminal domain-containing protein, partial [Pseudomonadota bacterium]
IEKHTGIRQRHMAGETEFAIDLARKAAERCLRTSKFAAEDIDLLICCNISRNDGPGFRFSFEPTTAIQLQQQLGCSRATCFDVSNACAGMFTAIKLASAFLQTGAVNNALIVSGEYITHLTDTAQLEITDARDPRMACLTLGDSGAAVTLEKSTDAAAGFAEIEMVTLGTHSDCCIGRATESGAGGAIMITDSRRIHRVAISQSVNLASEVLSRNGWRGADLEHLIMHQTAKGAIDELVRQFNAQQGAAALGARNMIYNVENRANTATTSHFVALWDQVHCGRINDNERICFVVQASGITLGVAPYSLDGLPGRLRAGAVEQTESARVQSDAKVGWYFPRSASSILAVGTAGVIDTREQDASAVALASAAAKSCLQRAGASPDTIDYLIYCGVHREEFLSEPAMAAILAGELDMNASEVQEENRRTFAFDVLSGGAGFLLACQASVAMMEVGRPAQSMVLAAEIEPNASRPVGGLLNRKVAGSAVLLGKSARSRGFVSFATFSFSEHLDAYSSYIGQSESKMPFLAIDEDESFCRHILDCTAAAVGRFFDESGLVPAEISKVLPPQVSAKFLDGLFERLPFSDEQWLRIADDQDLYTSSVALGFERLLERSAVSHGDLILMIDAAAGVQVICALYEY